jgi:hypothetical protein
MTAGTTTLRLNRMHHPVTTLGYGTRAGIWVQGCTIGCPGSAPRSPAPTTAESSAETAPANCPTCGAEVADPTNQDCAECLEPLTPTTHGMLSTPLRLHFPDQIIGVPATEIVLLGRDVASSPFSVLFADRDNISRRHASVGVHADGAAWVRDGRSMNGTYVNNMPIEPGATAPLADGDILRLASDVTARVELNRGGAE